MQNEFPHRGITMHRLPIGDNFPGLVFALGSALIFLIAIPPLWYVVAGAIAVGAAIAGILQLLRTSPGKFLSLQVDDNPASRVHESLR